MDPLLFVAATRGLIQSLSKLADRAEAIPIDGRVHTLALADVLLASALDIQEFSSFLNVQLHKCGGTE